MNVQMYRLHVRVKKRERDEKKRDREGDTQILVAGSNFSSKSKALFNSKGLNKDGKIVMRS